MQLLKHIQIFRKAYENMLNEIASQYNIANNEIKILLFLDKNEDTDIAKDIVDMLILSKSHVSMSVERLVQKGYLQKVQDESDKKKKHLKMAESAKELIKEADKKEKSFFNKMYNGITEEEKETMNQIFEKMYRNIKNDNI
ncbi:MAG: winged helix DNA-binding protein [Clostridia bacterium]|nr:winged helix DNA-binding protein [Clostridia bacterium]